MPNKQYLTFRLHNLQYGIEAELVQKISPLPEFTPIIEATSDIIGLLNLQGQIVPIIHLDLLQGHPVKGCNLSDYVLILQWEGLQFGIVAHQTDEVLELNLEVSDTEAYTELFGDINTALISGIAKVDENNIILLDPKMLSSQLDAILPLVWDAQMQLDVMPTSPISQVEQLLEQEESEQDEQVQISNPIPSFYDLYCPEATFEERAIFQQRADALKQPVESVEVTTELIPLAVIGLGKEYFGLNLELVREFTDISNLTPIPCCPNHIVGNMNLRGEIVTLVDIRNILNLPTPPIRIGSQAVVVQVDDIVAGLPVDQVLEMAYLNTAELTPLSGSLSEMGEQYLQGTTAFQEKMLRVLDLAKIFTQGELAVNEEA